MYWGPHPLYELIRKVPRWGGRGNPIYIGLVSSEQSHMQCDR